MSDVVGTIAITVALLVGLAVGYALCYWREVAPLHELVDGLTDYVCDQARPHRHINVEIKP
jgi:hypothetical protein